MPLTAEIDVDPQHGPVVRVTVGETTVAVYLMDETGVVTKLDGQYGIEVHGNWPVFKSAMNAVVSEYAIKDQP